MKNITRTIPKTTIKCYEMKNGKPVECSIDVVGSALTEEKAKKYALENGLLYNSLEVTESLYKMNVLDFVEHASIVPSEEKENETEEAEEAEEAEK